MLRELPEDRAKAQDIVDLCSLLLHIDAAKAYGLMEGGPAIDAPRCKQLLQQAEATRGLTPAPIPSLVAKYGPHLFKPEPEPPPPDEEEEEEG